MSTANATAAAIALSCQSAVATDYYGLGVRLGVYFAWATAYVANASVPEEIAGSLDTNAIFHLSLLVAMLRSTNNNGQLKQIDALVLLHLSVGGVFGVLSLWGYRTCLYAREEGPVAVRRFGGFGTHSRLFLAGAVCLYNLWFWVVGVRDEGGLYPVAKLGCNPLWTFFFARLHATGPIRGFYIVVSSLFTAYFGALLLFAIYARAARLFFVVRSRQWATTTRYELRTGFTFRELKFLFRYLRIISLAWLIWSVVAVEFILNFNKVKGVLGEDGHIYQPSQLIPMLIGLFSFIRIIWFRFKLWRSPHEELVLPPPREARDEPIPIVREKRVTSGPDVLKLFSAAHTYQEGTGVNDGSDYGTVHGPWPRRYLVGWLPWLSLLPYFGKDSKKRKSGQDVKYQRNSHENHVEEERWEERQNP